MAKIANNTFTISYECDGNWEGCVRCQLRTTGPRGINKKTEIDELAELWLPMNRTSLVKVPPKPQ